MSDDGQSIKFLRCEYLWVVEETRRLKTFSDTDPRFFNVV